jgi:uncharacterized protein YdbL (DUF1318 family)
MSRRAKIILGLGFALTAIVGGATYAAAQGAEASVVASARSSGLVGEQGDGYLGFVKTPSAELKAAVDAINIKRRAIYTEIAAKQNATVQEVAIARGCDQLAKRVAPGEWYNVGGTWQQRGSGPVALPGVCG